MINIADLFEKLNEKFNGQIELSESGQSIYVKREEVISFLKSLKEEYGYSKLADITSADYEDRYEVVYNLLNEKADILTAKVKLEKDNSTIPSATSIWRAASDQEREIYDLMGIGFEGHDNLTRILTQDGFEGHPLQKSFKLDRVSRF